MRRWRLKTWPLLAAAVGTEDVSPSAHEALVGQVEGAPFAVEAVLVPGAPLVVHHIYAFTETCAQRKEGSERRILFHFFFFFFVRRQPESASTCDGVLAAAALLRHGGLVTLHAEDLVLVFGEAHACQRLGAGAAHEAVAVPRLLLVADSPRGDGLDADGREEPSPARTGFVIAFFFFF